MYFRFYWVKTGQPTLLLHYQVLWPAKPIMAQDFSNITGSEHISKQPNRGHFGRWTVADWYSETHIRTLNYYIYYNYFVLCTNILFGGEKSTKAMTCLIVDYFPCSGGVGESGVYGKDGGRSRQCPLAQWNEYKGHDREGELWIYSCLPVGQSSGKE